ncbi:MAG: GlxA family transcriptional regulator [Paracoccaceae bacterium]
MQRSQPNPATVPRPDVPRRVDVLLFERFSNHCLAGAVEPLRAANTLAGRDLYAWRFLTPDGRPVASSSALPVTPAAPLGAAAGGGDYLFVAPSYDHRAHDSPATRRALRAAATRYGALVGLDTGAWLLAGAGLLDGRRATIHWDEAAAFAETFPAVEAVDAPCVFDGARITCAGASAAFDLVLRLIQAHHGAGLRLEVAALFLHGTRPPPAPLAQSGEARVDHAVALMRRNLERPLPIAEVAAGVGLGQRALEAAFAARLAVTPEAAYRRLRLAEVRRLLETTRLGVAEIALRCGWASPAALARAFRRAHGTSPRDWRAGR